MLIAGGVGIVAAGAGVAWSLRQPATAVDDEAAVALWQMTFDKPGGGSLALETLRGHPLLLNFWATWCAPCVKEMPLLDRFYRDRQSAGWTVLGLAVDGEAPVREYLARLPISFPIGLAGMAGAELSRTLGNIGGGLPFTVVFDRAGKVADHKVGALDEAHLKRWDRQLASSA
ncbi:MAG: TlpA family protein disulfide reductase [Rhizobacter sp.]